MKYPILLILIGFFINQDSYADYHPEGDDRNRLTDGPYIYQVNNKLKAEWIENGILKGDYIRPDNFGELKKNFSLLFNHNDLTDVYLLKPEYNQSYSGIDSMCVITDIHGEYDTYIDLLKGAGIIDKNLNWNFGRGHLVVLGDIFDRGDMVTEILWHLFGLEKRAAIAGGMVHVLLGNHELMMLRNNFSELNEKYSKVASIFCSDYSDLYSEESVLGMWLRSKPVVITINDIIFVHGGISIEMVRRNLTVKQINWIYANKVIGKTLQEVYETEITELLSGNDSPLWYRGYFDDPDFCESKIDSILAFYGKRHIVVGHTPYKEIRSLFNNKIMGADAGIMYKKPGEMIIYKNGTFYRSTSTNCRTKL
jgi:hypothetical protein